MIKLSPQSWRYLWQTRRELVLASIAVALSLILGVGVIFPQVQASFELRSQKQKLIDQNQQLSNKLAKLTNLPPVDLSTQAQTVNLVLPSYKPLLEILSALNALANQSQVSFQAVSLSPGKIATQAAVVDQTETKKSTKSTAKKTTAKAGTNDILELNIEVVGSLPAINNFFQRLEKMGPLTTVTKFELNKLSKPTAGLTNTFAAKLEIATYYFAQPVKTTIESNLMELTTADLKLIDELSQYFFPTVTQNTTITGGGQADLFALEKNLEAGLSNPATIPPVTPPPSPSPEVSGGI